MTIIKPGEAMSHGRIMRIKKEDQDYIKQKTKEFFDKGGKVTKLKDNER